MNGRWLPGVNNKALCCCPTPPSPPARHQAKSPQKKPPGAVDHAGDFVGELLPRWLSGSGLRAVSFPRSLGWTERQFNSRLSNARLGAMACPSLVCESWRVSGRGSFAGRRPAKSDRHQSAENTLAFRSSWRDHPMWFRRSDCRREE